MSTTLLKQHVERLEVLPLLGALGLEEIHCLFSSRAKSRRIDPSDDGSQGSIVVQYSQPMSDVHKFLYLTDTVPHSIVGQYQGYRPAWITTIGINLFRIALSK